MKKIEIVSENSSSQFIDEDETTIEDYCKQLDKIFKENLIVTMHFSSGSIVVRPSKIFKIVVEELSEMKNKQKPKRKINTLERKEPT